MLARIGWCTAVGNAVKSPKPVLVPEHPWEHSFMFYHCVVQVDTELWM